MIDEFTTPDITFLGEQDGPAERRLKEALGVVLGLDRTVIRAYLARVLYDGKTSGVMLALLTDDGEDSEKLVAQAGRTFAALFNTRSNLDVIFLSAEKDAEISQVCAPFYSRRA
ncbi:MAG: enhanced serine sensitivity protein SseB C-terminal domain-containing protein [Xanthobacteraceae bacterium]